MKILLDNQVEIFVPNDSAIAAQVFSVLVGSGGTIIEKVITDKPVKTNLVRPEGELEEKVSSGITKKRFTPEEQANIIEMANRKFSPREIAKKFDRSKKAMEQYIYKLRKQGLINAIDVSVAPSRPDLEI